MLATLHHLLERYHETHDTPRRAKRIARVLVVLIDLGCDYAPLLFVGIVFIAAGLLILWLSPV